MSRQHSSRELLSVLLGTLLSCVFFGACFGGGGGHGGGGGGGGGGGNQVIDLNVATSQSGPNLTLTDNTNASFGLVVSNIGALPSDQLVTVTVSLPTGITFASYTSTTPGWTCTATGQTITCTSSASIAGLTGTSTLTLTVSVATSTLGMVTMGLTVSTPDGTPSTHSFTASVIIAAPVPTLTSISPSSTILGGPDFTLTVNGTNFFSGNSQVQWNGSGRTTTFVSSPQLTATITASDILTSGTVSITVVNAAPGGGTSNALAFTVDQPVPTLTSISPTSATVGGPAFTLAVNGTSFTKNSQVQWNGSGRATTFLNDLQLTAAILTSDLVTTAGSASITVVNPTPGGGTSNAMTFTINATNPVPAITSLSPTSVTAGSPALTLYVMGSGFVMGSQVQWNGSNRATTYLASTSITAAITASDIATAGSAQVTVVNPAPGGGTSNAMTFTISALPPLTVVTTSPLPSGAVNVAYSTTLYATGGVTPYSWTLVSGALPTGLSLSTAGVISGTPTAMGTFSFTVKVTDSETPAQSATAALSLTITSSGLSITTTSPLTGADLNSPYSTTVTATSGAPPYTWALATSSTLPPGLALTSGSPSATISGTPTATGTFQFSLVVTDSTGATATGSFLLTVTGSSTFTCPSPVNLTLCGNYIFEGTNEVDGGSTGRGVSGTFVADNSGHIISGEQKSNDPVAGFVERTFTGGSYTMDPSGDGRGALTLSDSNAAVSSFQFTLHSAANAGPGPIVEGIATGISGSGLLWGPEATPLPQIPANTVLALNLQGFNGASRRVGLLGNFEIGSAGCDGSSGSFNSQTGEPLVTNSGGTVNTALSATGSCTAADANGWGTAQITLSGGTPFTSNTLNFVYLEVVASGAVQSTLFLETDALGTNQPILGGLGTPVPTPGSYNAATLSACPCLFVAGATTTGGITDPPLTSIVGVSTAPGTGNSGSLSGVIDQNAGGTTTSQGTWPYTAYSIDSNGVGTITGPGQTTIHFIIGSDTLYTLDESNLVQTGSMRQQNSVSIESPGAPYVVSLHRDGFNTNTFQVGGVIVPTGTTTTGTLSGTVDVVASSIGSLAGSTATGTYSSISSTTGRGTGTLSVIGGQDSVNVVIYAFRHRQFLVMDMQSTYPYVMSAQLQ